MVAREGPFHDAANPVEVIQDVTRFATAGRSQEEQEQIVQFIQQNAREWATHNFSSGCEVADMLLQRIDFGPDVREALRFNLCRCGTHVEIVRAVMLAARLMASENTG